LNIFDYFSEDNSQDWFFISSSIELAMKEIHKRHPKITETVLISDNGDCYHSTGFILWAMNIFQLTGIKLLEYAFFEPGEGKSIADQHFKNVDTKINDSLKCGKSISNPKEVGIALEGLSGTTFRVLKIDRNSQPPQILIRSIICTLYPICVLFMMAIALLGSNFWNNHYMLVNTLGHSNPRLS
jgi:hypothetical protein